MWRWETTTTLLTVTWPESLSKPGRAWPFRVIQGHIFQCYWKHFWVLSLSLAKRLRHGRYDQVCLNWCFIAGPKCTRVIGTKINDLGWPLIDLERPLWAYDIISVAANRLRKEDIRTNEVGDVDIAHVFDHTDTFEELNYFGSWSEIRNLIQQKVGQSYVCSICTT